MKRQKTVEDSSSYALVDAQTRLQKAYQEVEEAKAQIKEYSQIILTQCSIDHWKKKTTDPVLIEKLDEITLVQHSSLYDNRFHEVTIFFKNGWFLRHSSDNYVWILDLIDSKKTSLVFDQSRGEFEDPVEFYDSSWLDFFKWFLNPEIRIRTWILYVVHELNINPIEFLKKRDI